MNNLPENLPVFNASGTLAELQSAFSERWRTANTLARRTVEESHAAGSILVQIKARLEHGEWLPWLEKEGVTKDTSARLIRLSTLDISQLAKFDSVRAALASMPKTNAFKQHYSGEIEYYSPRHVVDAAREVLGAIDLDPASCEEGNTVVQAARFFTVDDDGLAQEWSGRVWLNPPYARALIGQFCDKFLDSEGIDAGIILVNNSTEARYCQRLLAESAAWCLPSARLKFSGPASSNNPMQGSLIAYRGPDAQRFLETFSPLGAVHVRPIEPSPSAAAIDVELTLHRAESAESEVEALRERLSIIEESAPDDWHGALDIAYQRTDDARQHTAIAQSETDTLRGEVRRRDRKLGRVRSALLDDVPRLEILEKYFGSAP